MQATQIGVFFDGTGNNMEKDIPYQCESNIAKMYRLYGTDNYTYKGDTISTGKKIYINGVGSTLGSRLVGGVTGLGAQQRLSEAYFKVKAFFDEDKNRTCEIKYIDIFGFSRGASLARHFVNMIQQMKLQNGDSDSLHSGVKIRFLGIFDTVSSFGIPGNNFDQDFDFSISPDDVSYCLHLTAEHERRDLFSLQSLHDKANSALPQGFTEYTCPGSHSDVGGGYRNTPYRKAGWYKQRIVNGKLIDVPVENIDYEDDKYLSDDARFAQEENEDENYYLPEEEEKTNELSRVPLNIMYQAVVDAGIKMTPQNTYPDYSSCIQISSSLQNFYNQNKRGLCFDDAVKTKYIHDSRYITSTLPSDEKREVYYNQPKQINWQEEKEIMLGVWDDYDAESA